MTADRERIARTLQSLEATVLDDRVLPSGTIVDHIVIGPFGLVMIDVRSFGKKYNIVGPRFGSGRGRLEIDGEPSPRPFKRVIPRTDIIAVGRVTGRVPGVALFRQAVVLEGTRHVRIRRGHLDVDGIAVMRAGRLRTWFNDLPPDGSTPAIVAELARITDGAFPRSRT